MKIEPSEFMIHKWFVENPENTMFTWSPWQLTHRTNMLLNSVQRDIIVPYVKKGDKVILWVHDKTIGIYAIGSVYEEPSYSNMDSKLIQYYTNFKELPPEILQVNIKLSVILHNDPISSVYCYKQGIANKPGPIKYPRRLPYEPPFQWSGFFSNPGKLDAYGWIPIKPIWRDIWEKSLEIIQSGTWHYS